jgi:amino acid transporter
MPTAKQKKKILLSGIALISLGGFSVVNSIEATSLAKAYGVLFVCQIGFLLFFLSRIRFRNHESAKTTKD